MSHDATNWAIKQRGLKPTTKIVLWHLCDRFNPDYGCFPSQARLAHDCEISRLLRQNGQRRRLSAPEHDQRRHVRIDAGTQAGHSRAPSHAGDPVNGLVSRPDTDCPSAQAAEALIWASYSPSPVITPAPLSNGMSGPAASSSPRSAQGISAKPQSGTTCAASTPTHWQRHMRGALSRRPMASGPWIWRPADGSVGLAQTNLFEGMRP
jgi:hypothetical protein